MDRRTFLGFGAIVGAGALTGTAQATFPLPEPPTCHTICFRDPEWWLSECHHVPYGVVLIGGYNFNVPVSTKNTDALELALGWGAFGPSTADKILSANFVAAQLSLIRAGGKTIEVGIMKSPLQCYGFAGAVSLSSGVVLTGSTPLQVLWDATRAVVTNPRAGNADRLTLIEMFRFLQTTCVSII